MVISMPPEIKAALMSPQEKERLKKAYEDGYNAARGEIMKNLVKMTPFVTSTSSNQE